MLQKYYLKYYVEFIEEKQKFMKNTSFQGAEYLWLLIYNKKMRCNKQLL